MFWIDIVKQINDIEKYIHPELDRDKATDNLKVYRSVLIDKLQNFKNVLESNYPEEVFFYVVFPLVSFCDEKVNLYLFSHMSLSKSNWELLQSEFFQRRDGGEHFFVMINALLDKKVSLPITIPILMNLLLKEGFKGKYYLENRYNITLYEKKLDSFIEDYTQKETLSKEYEDVLGNLLICQPQKPKKIRWYRYLSLKKSYIGAAIVGVLVVCGSYSFLLMR